MDINQVTLLGNLGANVELRYTKNQKAVAELRLGTSHRWRNAAGEQQEATEWHRIVIWGKQGEAASKYLHKGSQAMVQGRIQTRSWTDQQGVKHYVQEIIASNVVFLGGGKAAAPQQEEAPEVLDDEVPF